MQKNSLRLIKVLLIFYERIFLLPYVTLIKAIIKKKKTFYPRAHILKTSFFLCDLLSSFIYFFLFFC